MPFLPGQWSPTVWTVEASKAKISNGYWRRREAGQAACLDRTVTCSSQTWDLVDINTLSNSFDISLLPGNFSSVYKYMRESA